MPCVTGIRNADKLTVYPFIGQHQNFRVTVLEKLRVVVRLQGAKSR